MYVYTHAVYIYIYVSVIFVIFEEKHPSLSANEAFRRYIRLRIHVHPELQARPPEHLGDLSLIVYTLED